MEDADLPMSTKGPGSYFTDHPAMYRISLVGSAGTAVYATLRAIRTPGIRRLHWVWLAILEAAITIGIVNSRSVTPPKIAVSAARTALSAADEPKTAIMRPTPGLIT